MPGRTAQTDGSRRIAAQSSLHEGGADEDEVPRDAIGEHPARHDHEGLHALPDGEHDPERRGGGDVGARRVGVRGVPPSPYAT